MNTKSIKLEHVKKRFADEVVFDDLNLTIPGGKFFAILGPSGSGKTTLLRIIAGFESVDSGFHFKTTGGASGSISFDDENLNFRLFDDIHAFQNTRRDYIGMPSSEVSQALGFQIKSAIQLIPDLSTGDCFYVGFENDDIRYGALRQLLLSEIKDQRLATPPADPSPALEEEINIHLTTSCNCDLDAAQNMRRMLVTAPSFDSGDFAIQCVDNQHLWRIPHVVGETRDGKYFPYKFPISRIADWEYRSGNNGWGMLRLLIFHEGADLTGSLEDAIKRSSDYSLLISYTWGSEQQFEFIDFLTRKIEEQGCFSPAGRRFNPLRSA